MKFEIKHRVTGSILFECDALSLKLAVELAVEQKADLSSADLRYANLSYTNLRYANLSSANLSSADLRYANLSSADLRYTNLRYADLSSADLSSAELRYTNLSSANLSSTKDDFLKVLSVAKNEIIGLYDALMRGNIDGSQYSGECACLVGTIANIRHEKHDALTIDLRPDSDRPSERWFLSIKKGDIPQNSAVSAITAEWAREFMDAEKIEYPRYEIVAVQK